MHVTLPLRISPFAIWLLAVPASVVAMYALVPALFGQPGEPQGHALSHLLPGIAWSAIAVGMIATRAAARRGERVAVRALLTLGLAQCVEAVAAIIEYPVDAWLHASTSVLSMFAMGAVVLGVVWAIIAAAREGRLPWWIALVVGAAICVLFAKAAMGF